MVNRDDLLGKKIGKGVYVAVAFYSMFIFLTNATEKRKNPVLF